MSAIVPSPAPARPFRLNVEEAFRFLARDREWPGKLGLGAVFSFLSLVFVGSLLVNGYLLTLMERVARAEPLPLPEWEDYGELLRKGAIVFVVDLAYYLPFWIIFGIFFVVNFALILALAGLSSGNSGGAAAGAGLASLTLFLLMALALVLGFAISLILPAAHAQLALHDADLAAAFRMREVFDFIRRHKGQYALAALLGLAARSGLATVGYLLCFVGFFATNFASQLFLAHMIGQLCWHERVTRPPATTAATRAAGSR
jgi:hypothetical protein